MTHPSEVPPPTTPIPLLPAEELDPDWLEHRAEEISSWRKDGPYKQWQQAANEIDWAIATQSKKRMRSAFDGLYALTSSPHYDIEQVHYRSAKIVSAHKQAFWQRIERDAMGRRGVNDVYRNLAAVGMEIYDASFTKEPHRQLSMLSELVFIGSQMRFKDPLNFPYVALPREESSPSGAYVNHDCYLFSRSEQSQVSKKCIQIKLVRSLFKTSHPEVDNVNVLESVSGILHRYIGDVHKVNLKQRRGKSAKGLYELGLVARILHKDANNNAAEQELKILAAITNRLNPNKESGRSIN